jgi:hypothetical protein
MQLALVTDCDVFVTADLRKDISREAAATELEVIARRLV